VQEAREALRSLPERPVGKRPLSRHRLIMHGEESVETGRARLQRMEIATCIECKTTSGPRWRGWRAYRTDDPDLDGPPTLTLYCPTCAEREFGSSHS
jgi:hypothetical protein